MILQPSGILPAWDEDTAVPYPFGFVESESEGDWVLTIPSARGAEEGVRAGSVRFYHHKRAAGFRAQSFCMFNARESFLWRFWDESLNADFEWMIEFGGQWWWVPLRECRNDADSPHSIRFQVKVREAADAGLPRRAKKVYLFVRNKHRRLLFRQVFMNPDFPQT